MAAKLDANQTMMEMARHLSENNKRIASRQAVLYGGSSETGYPVYKLLSAKTYRLLKKHGIEPGQNYEIITDVLARMPAPELSTRKRRYPDMNAAMWGVEKEKLVGRREAGVLWKRASLFFARNSRVVAIVVGDKLRKSSVLLTVESLILSFNQSELGSAEKEKLQKLLARRKKATREVKEMDEEIYARARKAENLLRGHGWQLDYKNMKKWR